MKKIALFTMAAAAWAGEWSAPVESYHEDRPFLSYRARVDGGYLVIEGKLEPGWHTFTIDNKKRADEKLAGKPSLGIDLPTELAVASGLSVNGGWLQSPPLDFSKPAERWYSWGYENTVTFAAPVKRDGAGPAMVTIKGQACTPTTCKKLDLKVSVPVPAAVDQKNPAGVDLNTLVAVK
ncbi:MAG: hypothetical protein FJW40_12770 [Acidobacteria bacterium]|nr:hypothetical protein [Acidobacteriota bacterium]